jgi:tRNA dimethylallyltransferase
MRRPFFIVGPTATGKSELAADVAHEIGAEIVSADAFQIYQGLDRLTAKPDGSTLAKAPHHLVNTTPLRDEMNAEKYRRAASRAIDEINSRCKLAIVVGGSGLYIKTLTHGLAPLPESDPELREKLNAMSLDDLRSQLVEVDPETARKIDLKNRRRVIRALEICSLTGKPVSAQRLCEGASHSEAATGVFVFRDRQELYERINQRVEMMFERGVIEEVRTAGETSQTASQIQQATRRYAKRQLTWFRRQTNFSPLNLSFLTHNEAAQWISLRILSEAGTKDD